MEKMEHKERGIIMDKASVSYHVGKASQVAIEHNNRTQDYTPKNVIEEYSKYNRYYVQNAIREMYDNIFGDALDEYNQDKKPSRKIDNYYNHCKSKKTVEEVREIVVQIGVSRDDIPMALKGEILDEYWKDFELRNPNIKVFNSVLHMDEKGENPHLHISYVPVARYSKGMKLRPSMDMAIKQQGYDNFKLWQNAEADVVAELMAQHGIERKHVGTHADMSVREYQEHADRLEQLKVEVAEKNKELSRQQLEVELMKGSVQLEQAMKESYEEDVIELTKKTKRQEENLKKIKEEYKAEIKKITDAQEAYAEWLEQHQQVQIEQVKQNVTYYQFFMRWLTGDSSWEPYKDEYTEAMDDYIPELGQDNDPHIRMWEHLRDVIDKVRTETDKDNKANDKQRLENNKAVYDIANLKDKLDANIEYVTATVEKLKTYEDRIVSKVSKDNLQSTKDSVVSRDVTPEMDALLGKYDIDVSSQNQDDMGL